MMTFLAPLALLWAFTIPVLIWLWRLAVTQRQIRVPSLIPFEHLMRRQAIRRTRLTVNWLFWLQLLALVLLVGALARPARWRRDTPAVLVVMDTSASMGAAFRGSTVFARAQREVLDRLERKPADEQWLVVTTAPVTTLTPQPTGDREVLARAVRELRASHMSGSLATAARIGRALLAGPPASVLIVTDEPRPTRLNGSVQWVTEGAPLPNVAIVGLEAQGPLCAPTETRVVVAVHNFSDTDAAVRLTAAADGRRRLAEAGGALAAGARQSMSLALPTIAEGAVAIDLETPSDALEADNHAWLELRQQAARPVAVRSQASAFTQTLSAWLGACEALAWSVNAPAPAQSAVLITDARDPSTAGAGASTLQFALPSSERRPERADWLVATEHPIGAYLPPVMSVTAPLDPLPDVSPSGTPVMSALVDGRRVPVVMADEREGRRVVTMRLDPTRSSDGPQVVLAFFNSLRWLMGRSEGITTGEVIATDRWQPGAVHVHRPDGSVQIAETDGATLRYDATDVAGRYRFVQGTLEQTAAVNFFDPLESNLWDRSSTWRGLDGAVIGTAPPRRLPHPLWNVLTLLVLAILLLEWWLYSLKGTSLGAQGSGFRGMAHSPEPTARSLPVS